MNMNDLLQRALQLHNRIERYNAGLRNLPGPEVRYWQRVMHDLATHARDLVEALRQEDHNAPETTPEPQPEPEPEPTTTAPRLDHDLAARLRDRLRSRTRGSS